MDHTGESPVTPSKRKTLPLVENCQNARGCFSSGDSSVHSLATDFSCCYHGFTLIRTYVIIFVLDLSITKCFMKLFFKFERVLLVTRGCSSTLKTRNSPPVNPAQCTSDSAILIGWRRGLGCCCCCCDLGSVWPVSVTLLLNGVGRVSR